MDTGPPQLEKSALDSDRLRGREQGHLQHHGGDVALGVRNARRNRDDKIMLAAFILQRDALHQGFFACEI